MLNITSYFNILYTQHGVMSDDTPHIHMSLKSEQIISVKTPARVRDMVHKSIIDKYIARLFKLLPFRYMMLISKYPLINIVIYDKFRLYGTRSFIHQYTCISHQLFRNIGDISKYYIHHIFLNTKYDHLSVFNVLPRDEELVLVKYVTTDQLMGLSVYQSVLRKLRSISTSININSMRGYHQYTPRDFYDLLFINEFNTTITVQGDMWIFEVSPTSTPPSPNQSFTTYLDGAPYTFTVSTVKGRRFTVYEKLSAYFDPPTQPLSCNTITDDLLIPGRWA